MFLVLIWFYEIAKRLPHTQLLNRLSTMEKYLNNCMSRVSIEINNILYTSRLHITECIHIKPIHACRCPKMTWQFWWCVSNKSTFVRRVNNNIMKYNNSPISFSHLLPSYFLIFLHPNDTLWEKSMTIFFTIKW